MSLKFHLPGGLIVEVDESAFKTPYQKGVAATPAPSPEPSPEPDSVVATESVPEIKPKAKRGRKPKASAD